MTSTICAEYSTHTTDHPPVGPCVLRPGHRGHIHQDVRGIQWATQPGGQIDSAQEAARRDAAETYPLPFLIPSTPVERCGTLSSPVFDTAPAECVLRPGHSGSHADNHGARWRYFTDESSASPGSAGELRGRLAAALRVMHRSEQEIADLRAELRARDEVIAQQRAAAQRALRDVAAVVRVRDLADRWYGQGVPATSYARELLSTLDNAA